MFSINTNVFIICDANCKTVKQKTILTLFKICEKPIVPKLLNAAMLFKDHVHTETSTMCEPDDVHKVINLDYFVWTVNRFFKSVTHESEKLREVQS